MPNNNTAANANSYNIFILVPLENMATEKFINNSRNSKIKILTLSGLAGFPITCTSQSNVPASSLMIFIFL